MGGIGIVAMKLGLAGTVGLALGLEREAKHKPLGLKTCIVIAIASCLLTIVSIDSALNTYEGNILVRSDPMRLAAQIISGVGFLGAGVILRNDSNVITGLTTAAIVWSAAGFGIGIGAGYYVEVAIGVTLILLSVSFLPYIMRKIGPTSLRLQETSFTIQIDNSVSVATVIEEIEALVTSIKNVQVKGNEQGQQLSLRCFIDEKQGTVFSQYDKMRKMTGITEVEIKKLQ